MEWTYIPATSQCLSCIGAGGQHAPDCPAAGEPGFSLIERLHKAENILALCVNPIPLDSSDSDLNTRVRQALRHVRYALAEAKF